MGRILTCPRCKEEHKLVKEFHGYELGEVRWNDPDRYQCSCPHCRKILYLKRPERWYRKTIPCKHCKAPCYVSSSARGDRLTYILTKPAEPDEFLKKVARLGSGVREESMVKGAE